MCKSQKLGRQRRTGEFIQKGLGRGAQGQQADRQGGREAGREGVKLAEYRQAVTEVWTVKAEWLDGKELIEMGGYILQG